MSKRTPTLIVGGLVIGVTLFTVVLWLAQTRQAPARARADALASIPVNGKVGFVAQITAIEGNTLTIEVLAGKDYAQRTGARLQAERGKERILIGGESDIRVGAVAQFDGVKTGVNALRLVRVTILTGYYSGPPGK